MARKVDRLGETAAFEGVGKEAGKRRRLAAGELERQFHRQFARLLVERREPRLGACADLMRSLRQHALEHMREVGDGTRGEQPQHGPHVGDPLGAAFARRPHPSQRGGDEFELHPRDQRAREQQPVLDVDARAALEAADGGEGARGDQENLVAKTVLEGGEFGGGAERKRRDLPIPRVQRLTRAGVRVSQRGDRLRAEPRRRARERRDGVRLQQSAAFRREHQPSPEAALAAALRAAARSGERRAMWIWPSAIAAPRSSAAP